MFRYLCVAILVENLEQDGEADAQHRAHHPLQLVEFGVEVFARDQLGLSLAHHPDNRLRLLFVETGIAQFAGQIQRVECDGGHGLI